MQDCICVPFGHTIVYVNGLRRRGLLATKLHTPLSSRKVVDPVPFFHTERLQPLSYTTSSYIPFAMIDEFGTQSAKHFTPCGYTKSRALKQTQMEGGNNTFWGQHLLIGIPLVYAINSWFLA